MALSSRDLYLVLRARDEASRVVRGLSTELLRAGAMARAAAARAQAAGLRQQALQARAAGATAAQVRALNASAQAWDNEANRILRNAAARQRLAGIMQTTSQALITSGVAAAAIGAVTLAGLYRTIGAAQEYERQVRLATTQTDDFAGNLQKVHDIGLKVARTVGVAFEQIQPALFDILSSTNATIGQAEKLLTSFSKAAVAGQTDIQSASRSTLAIMNAFNIPLERVNDVLDVQFQLVRFGVGTYEEFAGVIGNVIPSATRAGQSLETVAAMMAFLTRNGLSASMAATSAARALEAMSHPKTVQRMEAMGIKVRDAAGNMRPLTDILSDLRTKIMNLPPSDRVAALVDLLKSAGGTIQARRFLEQVLLRPGELEELIGFLGNMEDATGAFERAYAGMSDSLAAKTQLLKNQWQALKIGIGEAVIPAFTQLMGILSKLVESFNNLPASTKSMIAQFLVWGSVLGIVGGALLVLLGVLAGVIAAFAAGGTALGMFLLVFTAAATYVGIFVAALITMWQNSQQLRGAVMQLVSAFQALWAKIVEVAGPIGEAIRSQLGDKVIEGFRKAGEILGGFISTIAGLVRNYLIPALSALAGFWEQNRATIEPLLAILGQVIKFFIMVGAAVVGVIALLGAGGLVAAIIFTISMFMTFIKVIQFVIAAVKAVGGAIGDLINWIGRAIVEFRNFGTQVRTVVSAIPAMIRGFFADAGSWLVSAGRAIIQGLVNGIKSAIGAVRDALGAVTSMIPDWKGPKQKDLRLLRPTGKFLMRGLAYGIGDGRGLVKQALADVTGKMTTLGGVDPLRATASGVTHSKTVNQTVNVTTQEIDPRYHAAQLGWELQAVMP